MLNSPSKGMTLKSDTESDSPLQMYKTYYPSNRNSLPLKILGLLFVKRNTFILKTPCIPWQWRFREDVDFKILAGVYLT